MTETIPSGGPEAPSPGRFRGRELPLLMAVIVSLVVANRVALAHQLAFMGVPPHEMGDLFRRDLVRAIVGIAIFPGLGPALWSRTFPGGGVVWRGPHLVAFVVGMVATWFHLDWMYAWIRENYLGMPGWLAPVLTGVSGNAAILLGLVVLITVARNRWR